MKSIYNYILLIIAVVGLASCDDWLEREPQTILTDEQVWSDPELITSVISDVYSRLPKHTDFTETGNCGATDVYCGWKDYAAYDEAIWSGVSNFDYEVRNNIINYPFLRWSLWNYTLIRDINLAIENIGKTESAKVSTTQKEQFIAELRFLRALNYFELVKRMGGVPLITTQLIYDFSGDPSPLRQPRDSEEAVYDFIRDELDDIKDKLGNEGSQTRANSFTALALKSRAMLYAGSLAKYNSLNPISLPGGEVGIPSSRAVDYYASSLEAAKEIIDSNVYSLYQNNPDLGENFYEAVTQKSNNNEAILVIDYSASQGLRHPFTLNNIPRSLRLDVANVSGSSAISPSLNLVEDYEYLDGTEGSLRGTGTGSNTAAGQQNWIFYDQPEDIFENKDPRLYGTIIYPGATFAGQPINLQAGVYVWNEGADKYDRVEGTLNSTYSDDGTLVGADGPMRNENYVSATGFYLRKYIDSSPSGATSSIQSDVWWVWFRLAEVYLNAGEAAFELGLSSEAVSFYNALRERAGFSPETLTVASLTLDRVRNERRVELAFEDHRVWDLKRWRIAHEYWDGNTESKEAMNYALFGYRIVRPGHPNHGKYVYDKFPAPRQIAPRFFRLGNYYSQIPQDVLNNNPEIVRNPFH
ncbi:RagB/SusD family nutrient uptake outer membrane protein [Algoriphagus sp. NG3]|uniref:RagB/SusD family nutrient uptake outer membrane protein n=1 Tax=Algoriphagus sp. NG3 TaxID=3097546 RepID=UPI002A7F31E8|nr:RagB/SusD family nutrient uptake outer membrane protein [Algoriphagus sp. NG3]WPR77253.1 RagB/SusD family nutrient uptake outer membrane protein [Algoriphagus sp. NG3]